MDTVRVPKRESRPDRVEDTPNQNHMLADVAETTHERPQRRNTRAEQNRHSVILMTIFRAENSWHQTEPPRRPPPREAGPRRVPRGAREANVPRCVKLKTAQWPLIGPAVQFCATLCYSLILRRRSAELCSQTAQFWGPFRFQFVVIYTAKPSFGIYSVIFRFIFQY